MKKHSLLSALGGALFCVFAVTASAWAQAPPGGGPQPGGGGGPANTPIDGGISLLLASGAAYGLKRLRRQRA